MKYRAILGVFITIFAVSVIADDVLYGVNIQQVYAQSKAGSTAHLIKIDKALPEVCSANRLYIDFEDTDLFATVLALFMAEKQLDIVYNVESPSRKVRRHTTTTCKLIGTF